MCACLGLLFSVLITAVITDAIKDAVGRPRPDFFWRCFPNGKGVGSPLHQLSLFLFPRLLTSVYFFALDQSYTQPTYIWCMDYSGV